MTGAPADRLLLLASSPRLPAGLLSAAGWQALHSGPVYTADETTPQAQAVRAAGIPVSVLSTVDERAAAHELRERARPGGVAVWLAGPDGDPGLARAVGDLVARSTGVELEVVYGSWDPPGARLLDVVAVMDRLRSPGGCPWDAEQTHTSLMRYLLEEAYEAYEALELADTDALREELGDLLLQIAFHARLAEELPDGQRWSIDDVAGHLVDKLIRRHPHVFAGVAVSGAGEVSANWERIKRAEKQRWSVTEGVPMGQPALTLAATLQRKGAKLGLPPDAPDAPDASTPDAPDAPDASTPDVPDVPDASTPDALDASTPDAPDGAGHELGRRLWALVAEARAAGLDPESELRAVARAYRDAVRQTETEGRDRPEDHRR